MLEINEQILRCCICSNEKRWTLTHLQMRRLAEGERLPLQCSYCCCQRYWMPLGSASAPPQTEPCATARSILVAEDDEPTGDLIRKMVQSSAANVDVAKDGKQALAMLTGREYDLLICDLKMPEMDGYQLFRRIRDDALLPERHVVFLTGDTSVETRQLLDSTGCYHFYKPIELLKFTSQIRELLAE